MNSAGAFSAPVLFDLFLDRIAADVYPSQRYVQSAILSARSTDQLDRLLDVLGKQTLGQYLSPRRLQMMSLVAERRSMMEPARQALETISSAEEETAEVTKDELRSAVELLQQTSALLDD